MKRIRKAVIEPMELATYRNRFHAAPRPPGWSGFKKDPDRRNAVKVALRNDQRGLCACCERQLVVGEESVEHFHAVANSPDRGLDWRNLLLVCKGDESVAAVPSSDLHGQPRHTTTCGLAKGCRLIEINPLEIPAFPRLFRIESETGQIQPDYPNCSLAGVDGRLVADTLGVLQLNSGRLRRARKAVADELLVWLELDNAGDLAVGEREFELASQQFSASDERWPQFFTTIRFALGEGAERYLRQIDFVG